MSCASLKRCLLVTGLLGAACGSSDDRTAPSGDAGTGDAAGGVMPDGATGVVPDARAPDGRGGFDSLDRAGLQALDVPRCLAGLSILPAGLRQLVSELSGATEAVVEGKSVRIDGRYSEENRALARAYLRERYLALGYAVAEHPYGGDLGTGSNLVAERSGDDRDFVIVSSHLDTVSGSPGADDDASGTATAFAIAAALKDCAFAHSVRFVAFDQEERGLIGSAAYASEVAGGAGEMLGMIQIEMNGYDSDRSGDYLIVHCNKPDSVALASTLVAAVGTLELPLRHNLACTQASDHASFWGLGRPAIVISEHFFPGVQPGPADPNPCYHRACDTVDTLDFEYMATMATATTLAISALAGAK